jgi:hypothetical protein
LNPKKIEPQNPFTNTHGIRNHVPSGNALPPRSFRAAWLWRTSQDAREALYQTRWAGHLLGWITPNRLHPHLKLTSKTINNQKLTSQPKTIKNYFTTAKNNQKLTSHPKTITNI